MLASLTPRQKEILDFINMYYDINKISPSLEEIKQHFNLKAVSTVHEHVEKLKEKGYLRKEMNQARGIRTTFSTEVAKNMIEVDVLGNIAAGEPIEAVENAEPIFVSSQILPKTGNLFALNVKGDSMIEEGIFDGDIVIIKSQSEVVDGETVVAIVDDDYATLKKFYRERDRVRLQPANEKLKPMYFKKVEVRGKVVALVRMFQ